MCEILRNTQPNIFVSASHELSREYREYERTSTVAANAYVGPKVSQYLSDLEGCLRNNKFVGNLLIMQSNGGLSDVELARRQCIQMMESGPAGGVVGTMALCEMLDLEAAIAFDMGGTTAKACAFAAASRVSRPIILSAAIMRGLPFASPSSTSWRWEPAAAASPGSTKAGDCTSAHVAPAPNRGRQVRPGWNRTDGHRRERYLGPSFT